MATVKQIRDYINGFAPEDSAESYDNVGIILGSGQEEVTGILLCVDVTAERVAEAEAAGANLIISHHPLIFEGLEKINPEGSEKAWFEAVKKGMAVIAAHTNADKMQGSMSELIAAELGAEKVGPLTEDGIGIIADIPRATLKRIKEKLSAFTGDGQIKTAGGQENVVSRLAVVSGSGGRDRALLESAIDGGADLYISGEFRHDLLLWAKGKIMLMEISHYGSEKSFSDIMFDRLKPCFGGKIIKSVTETSPYDKEM